MRLGPFDEWDSAKLNNAISLAKRNPQKGIDLESNTLTTDSLMDINDIDYRGYYGSMHKSVLNDLTVGGGKDSFNSLSNYMENDAENPGVNTDDFKVCKTQEEIHDIIFEECKSYLPFLKRDDITPDGVGFHPKRQKTPEEGMQDWILKHEKNNGFPNVYSCVGIESPGITASEAIGEYMANLVEHTSQ